MFTTNVKAFLIILLMLILLLCAYGCTKPAKGLTTTDNNNFYVQELFTTKEGVTLYRFVDDGRLHYFSTKASVETFQSNGKVSWKESINTPIEVNSKDTIMTTTICPHCNNNISLTLKH